MTKRVILAALLAGAALRPAPLCAQAAAPAAPWRDAAAPRPAAPAVGLGVAPLARLAPRFADTDSQPPLARARSLEPILAPALAARARSKPGVALMIVGGAGIIVGSIVEEDIITIAGAGVGLYGLYLYLR